MLEQDVHVKMDESTSTLIIKTHRQIIWTTDGQR